MSRSLFILNKAKKFIESNDIKGFKKYLKELAEIDYFESYSRLLGELFCNYNFEIDDFLMITKPKDLDLRVGVVYRFDGYLGKLKDIIEQKSRNFNQILDIVEFIYKYLFDIDNELIYGHGRTRNTYKGLSGNEIKFIFFLIETKDHKLLNMILFYIKKYRGLKFSLIQEHCTYDSYYPIEYHINFLYYVDEYLMTHRKCIDVLFSNGIGLIGINKNDIPNMKKETEKYLIEKIKNNYLIVYDEFGFNNSDQFVKYLESGFMYRNREFIMAMIGLFIAILLISFFKIIFN